MPILNLNQFPQPSSIYWPEIQQTDIADFKYDILFVLQPMMGNELPGLVLEFELNK